jgi:predicted ATP-grasp superfamily ATP-dependent carboligase
VKRSIDVLVLNARMRQSLIAVRSLGRQGLAVGAVDTMADVPAFRSRWCRRYFVSPAAEEAPASLTYLERLLYLLGAPVLISSHDGTIALLRQNRARLEKRTRIALASEPAMSIAMSKECTLQHAAQLGIRIPHSVLLTGLSDVPEAVAEIGLPAVVKPAEAWLASGLGGMRMAARLVTTLDEAHRAVADVERVGATALLQTLVAGRREAVSFLYANGEMHARFAQWENRVTPPLGEGFVLRQSIPIPVDIGGQAEQLVRSIGLEGYSEVEFRRDAVGVPHLMGIKPRLSASVGIAVRSGVDFPSLLYQWANGDPIDHVSGYRTGSWMRCLQSDVTTTIAALAQRGMSGVPSSPRAVVALGLSVLKPMRYDYIDWEDPRPAVKAMADFAGEVTRGAGRAIGRNVESVPSLSFIGVTSLRAYGPLDRFFAGCRASARRVAGDVARKVRHA